MLSDIFFMWLVVVVTYIACIIVDNVFWDDDDWSERGKKK